MNRFSLHMILILCLAACSGNSEDNPEAIKLFIKGKQAYNKKLLKQADAYFTEALSLQENLLNARLMRGKINYYHKKYSDALMKFNTVLEYNNSHTGALYWKAKTLVVSSKDKDEDAIKYLNQVLDIDSGHIRSRLLLAVLYEKNKNIRKALYEYNRLLIEEEVLLNARANLGLLYHNLGLNEKSLQEMKKAMTIAEACQIKTANLKLLQKEMRKEIKKGNKNK